jgi:hypothetical protein
MRGRSEHCTAIRKEASAIPGKCCATGLRARWRVFSTLTLMHSVWKASNCIWQLRSSDIMHVVVAIRYVQIVSMLACADERRNLEMSGSDAMNSLNFASWSHVVADMEVQNI